MVKGPVVRKLKIGLIGLYRCGNLGDEAIWQAFAQTLHPMLPEGSKIRMVTFGPGGFESAWLPRDRVHSDGILHRLAMDDPGARSINWSFWLGQGWPRFSKLLGSFDAVWYAGGHWIHDLSVKTLLGVMAPLIRARIKGTNAGFVNVGAGPLETYLGRAVTNWATRGRGPLVVRDDDSVRVLGKAGVRRPVVSARDAAFLLDPAPAEEIEPLIERLGIPRWNPIVGIVPCAWFKMSHLYQRQHDEVARMIDTLAGLIRDLNRRGLSAALIPTMLPEDEGVCREILSRAGGESCFLFPTRSFTARTLLGLIGRLRALISFRMHPVLFAYRMRTPFVALDYAPKLASLVREAGLAQWLVPLDTAWPERLTHRVHALLDDRDPLAGALPADRMRTKAKEGLVAALETLS